MTTKQHPDYERLLHLASRLTPVPESFERHEMWQQGFSDDEDVVDDDPTLLGLDDELVELCSG